MSDSDALDAAPAEAAPADPATDAPESGDKLLLGVFWAWAALLLVATLAQLFGWDGVLDLLDVKRWFAH